MSHHVSRLCSLSGILRVCVAAVFAAVPALADDEPFAVVGDGGMFDREGQQMVLSIDFVSRE